MIFSESLLHFIWRFRLYAGQDLQTLDQEQVTVVDVGEYNQNAGPDFLMAKIKIDQTLWIGHVEIHIEEKDWLLHQHQLNKSYDNTILHVVWEVSQKSILRTDGTRIPTVQLKDYVDADLLARYAQLMGNLDWIPCVRQLQSVRRLTISTWLARMTVVRLEQKLSAISELLLQTKYDWEYVFLIILGRSFGMKVNADAFERLCSSLDLKLIHKYQSDPHKIEALLFGIAGFLKHSKDKYTSRLESEFSYLQHLHQLNVLNVEQWRFLRMRPYNFPTFRLGQFAALLQHKSYWFQYILEVDTLSELIAEIGQSRINDYWKEHYRLNIQTVEHEISWTASFKHHILINSVIPMLFAYGNYMKLDSYKHKAIAWLNEIPAEKNQIIKKFETHKVHCVNAADSQALLAMKSLYCDQKQCLACAIGLEILKKV